MKALVVGATGLVGNICLNLLLADSFYNEVEVWVRKTTGLENEKLSEKIVDFSQIENMTSSCADHIYCCLGTTIKKAGSQAGFRKVDHDYVVELGRFAEKYSASKIIVVSSIGAKIDSSNFYLRTKGEMEKDLNQLQIPAIYILQPSFILGERNEFRFGEKIGQYLIIALGFLLTGKKRKYRGIKAITIAKAMISLAKTGELKKLTFESDTIQKLGK
jgi:uncharacterized protein YbjT (DUF2867 family)